MKNKYVPTFFSRRLLGGYTLSLVIHSLFFVYSPSYAESPVQQSPVIAVLVDSSLSDALRPDLERYTTQYIQQRYGNSKAIVIPINTTVIKAADIVRMLENIYFEGIKTQPSSLIGLIMIGDIPLPVAHHNGFVFPTVLPYTDFEQQQYLFNKDTTYFERNNNTDGQPEIWHGLIQLGANPLSYKQFFQKLKTYEQNPSGFIGSKIRYDDLSYLKENIDSDNVSNYINPFLFAEDIGYHRFSSVLLNFFNGKEQEKISSLATTSTDTSLVDEDNPYEDDPVFNSFSKDLDAYNADLDAQIQQASNIGGLDATATPTLVLGQSIQSFVKTYSQLVSPVYRSTLRDNIQAGGRRSTNTVDTHAHMIDIQDDLLTRSTTKEASPVLVDYNDQLGQSIVQQLQQAKARMHTPVLIEYDEIKGREKCFGKITKGREVSCGCNILQCPFGKTTKRVETIKKYQTFFFGKNAASLTGVQDATIYRGTYLNAIDYSQVSGTQSSSISPFAGVSVQTRSHGSSRGINDRQTSSHRGYNVFLAAQEDDLRTRFKDTSYMASCSTNQKNNIMDFINVFWGGVSPINLIQDSNGSLVLGSHSFQNAREPFVISGTQSKNAKVPSGIGGPLYDPAGTRLSFTGQINAAYSYKSLEAFASIQKITELPEQEYGDEDATFAKPDICVSREFKTRNETTIFTTYPKTAANRSRITININGRQLSNKNNCTNNECVRQDIYSYKTLPTLQINDSPTPNQLSGMNIATLDRGIDSVRTVTFQGVGGGTISIPLPNLYNIPVYTGGINGIYTLMNPNQINAAIKQYLVQYIKDININLTAQNRQRTTRYNSQKITFDLLGNADPLATPNRSVTLLDETILIKLLGNDSISTIADQLYKLNAFWPVKQASNTLQQHLDSSYQSIDMSSKISGIFSRYLTEKQEQHPIRNPGYQVSGYQALFLNTDNQLDIIPTQTPSFVSRAQQLATLYQLDLEKQLNELDILDTSQTSTDDRECNIGADGAVSIDKWPGAFECWLQKTLKKPLSLSLNFNQAQGPVLLPQGSQQSIGDQLETYSAQRTQSLVQRNESQQEQQNLTPQQQESLQTVRQELLIGFSDSFFPLEPIGPIPTSQSIDINTTQPFKDVSISIRSTGDNCLSIGGTNTCLREYRVNSSTLFEQGGISVPFSFVSKKIGETLVITTVCSAPKVCYDQFDTLQIGPGVVDAITIQTPSNTIIQGIQFPVVIKGFDAFGNQLGQQLQRFQVRINTGKFLNGTQSMEFSSFDDMSAIIDTSKLSQQQITNLTITISMTGENMLDGKIINPVTQSVQIVPATLSIAPSGSPVNISLPTSLDQRYTLDTNQIRQYVTGSLPTIRLNLRGPNNTAVDSSINIRSTYGLVDAAVIQRVNITGNLTQQKLQTINTINTSGGNASIIIKPRHFKVGTDQLIVSRPGGADQIINVTILPSQASQVILQTSRNTISNTKPISATLSVQDIRGNNVTGTHRIRLVSYGPIRISDSENSKDILVSGSYTQLIQSQGNGGKAHLVAYLQDVPVNEQRMGYQSIASNSPIVPVSGLNVLYATLLGQDRGNQRGYFSEYDQGGKQLINNSSKLLSISTLLTDPSKLKSTIAKIDASLNISSSQNIAATISLSPDGSVLQLPGLATINLGNPRSALPIQLLQSTASLNNLSNTAGIYYLPNTNDSIIKSNTLESKRIRVNGNTIIDFQNNTMSSGTLIARDLTNSGTRIVSVQGKQIGRLIMKNLGLDLGVLLTQSSSPNSNYQLMMMFGEGSTNGNLHLGIVDQTSSFDNTKKIPSLEDADNQEAFVGFRGGSKHLTSRAAGSSVGEATKPFLSAFSINLGDPLLLRTSDNPIVSGTSFDKSLGITLATDPQKTIFKVLPGDFNNDKLEDLFVVYTDGTVRLIKQYQPQQFTMMGDLVLIAGGIKEIEIGDTRGDQYPDLLIRTNNDKLKIYDNNRGIFDVDGLLVCLDIPGGPDSIQRVEQIFFQDMDLDGALDIITNDDGGKVSIFYGGASDQGAHYISTVQTHCDDSRKQRQQGQYRVVKHKGVAVDLSKKVVDTSLIRRKGLSLPTEQPTPDTSDTENFPDLQNPFFNKFLPSDSNPGALDSLTKIKPPKLDIGSLDMKGIVNAATNDILRYLSSPTDYIPSGEILALDDIRYVPLSKLNNADPIKAYKTYENLSGGSVLLKGDTVRVTITIQADQQGTYTYIDSILGPRIIEPDSQGRLQGRSGNYQPTLATLDESYAYIIDDIRLNAGQSTSRSYELIYNASSPLKISIQDRNQDTYPDITLYDKESCTLQATDMLNQKLIPYRSYRESVRDLGSSVSNIIDQQQQGSDNAIGSVTDQVSNITQNQDLSSIPGMDALKERRSRGQSFGSTLLGSNGNISFNLNLNAFDQQLDSVNKNIDNAVQGLCKGFSLNKKSLSCGGLPIPFNTAFLAPGNFNVMGCHIAKDKGLPVFHFPGTLNVAGIPVPFPRGLKSPSDSFYRPGGGQFPSFIRIYAAPTTTLGLGIGICFGPNKLGLNLPKLVRDLGGNCIVIGATLPNKCNAGAGVSDGGSDDQIIDDDRQELGDLGQCPDPTNPTLQASYDDDTIGSPFLGIDLTNLSQDILNTANSPAGDNSYRRVNIAPGTYVGMINFSMKPINLTDTSSPDNIQLRGGKTITNRIGFGASIKKTIAKCVIQGRLDNQIRYMLNNLTNMTVALYLPNVSDLFQGFDGINLENLQSLMKQNQSSFDQTQPGATGSDFNPLNKGSYDNLSKKISNPFDALSSLFNQVPLVHISTKDISVQIPLIYSEDITRYSSYLQTRLAENSSKLKERGSIIDDTFKFCGIEGSLSNPQFAQTLAQQRESLELQLDRIKAQSRQGVANLEQDISVKQACLDFASSNSLKNLISFNTQGANALRAVRQNIRVLEQYKRFPLQLYEWIHVTDRYLSELSSVVANTLGTLNNRLKINARRFEQYANTIILMIGIIKTRQIVIDVSVNRQQKCSKCKNDNYDSYSCSMSFLCPPLPILPIPPFKIPNIYLDFSSINLNLNIVLPKFNFTPVSIPLPRLPTLPSPPTVRLNLPTTSTKQFGVEPLKELAKLTIPGVSLPEIPVLPTPPQLPPLPSFIPSVNLQLPVLPPPPRIPKIAPNIQSAIKALDKLGKIFCIIKGGIGLVGEATLKSKIEQLTQRTRNIPFFDQMLTTRVQPPLKGFDYRIDAFVRLQYNFDGVVSLLDGIAQQVNQRTNKQIITPSQRTVSEISNQLNNNSVTNGINGVGNQTINLNIQGSKLQDSELMVADSSTYEEALQDMSIGLQSLQEYVTTNEDHKAIESIISSISRPVKMDIQEESIQEVNTHVQDMIQQKRSLLAGLPGSSQDSSPNDYDALLAKISTYQLVDNEDINAEYAIPLISMDSQSQEYIDRQDHPLLTYLQVNQGLVKGYQQALINNNPSQLNMNNETHEMSLDYLSSISQRIDQTSQRLQQGYIDPLNTSSSSTQTPILAAGNASSQIISSQSKKRNLSLSQHSCPLTIPSIPGSSNTGSSKTTSLASGLQLFAQASTEQSDTNSSSQDVFNQLVNMTNSLKGVWIPIDSGSKVNVVQSEYNSSRIKNNYLLNDMSRDGIDDLIMRDEQSIYLKYGRTTAQRIPGAVGPALLNTNYYQTVSINSIQQLNQLLTNDGYISVRDIQLKLRSKHYHVKNFRISGQSFDRISVSRSNSSVQQTGVDGYLISYQQRIDLLNDLNIHRPLLPLANQKTRYILVLPRQSSLTGALMSIPGVLDQESINNLLTGTISQVVYVDTGSLSHTISISQISREWHYLTIQSLQRTNQGTRAIIYQPISPRSQQIVGGVQIDADTQGPTPTIKLQRNLTQQTVSNGIYLRGLINTVYNIDIQREDKGGVSYNQVISSGLSINRINSGNKMILSGLLFTGTKTYPLTISAKDFNGNTTTQQIQLVIEKPSLSITSINKLSDQLLSVTSRLSSDLDTGFVAFQRQQQNRWITLTGVENSIDKAFFPVIPQELMITGGVFTLGNLIGFWNPGGQKIATLDPNNGDLRILSQFQSTTDIRVSLDSSFPLIQIRHGNPLSRQFELYLPPALLTTGSNAIQILDGSYSLYALSSTGLNAYNNGYCIRSQQDCEIYISPGGEIFVPKPYHGQYEASYLFDQGRVIYQFRKIGQSQAVASISIVTKPFQ